MVGIKSFAIDVGNKTRREIENRMELACQVIQREAEALTPVDLGNLKASNYHKVISEPNEIIGRIGNYADYALHILLGTRPHKIEAKYKKVLAVPVAKFKGHYNSYESKELPKLSKDGSFVILGKKVMHPGFKGFDFLTMAYENTKQEVMRILTERSYYD